LETRALFAGSQGGTVARAGGNVCGPLSARLDLKARGPAIGYGPHRTIYLTGIDANGKVAERGGPMTPKAFYALFGRIGQRAKMPFPVHPHMLRHGCGYALANAGHDTRALQAWLGHKNIQHTVRYTELAPDRFKNFWR
jgi:integrase